MKILRFYWDPSREQQVNDIVLYVIKETKTQLVAINRRTPNYQYRFRKPDKLQTGMWVRLVGKQERFSQFHYELYLE